jgi:hypothetical protein
VVCDAFEDLVEVDLGVVFEVASDRLKVCPFEYVPAGMLNAGDAGGFAIVYVAVEGALVRPPYTAIAETVSVVDTVSGAADCVELDVGVDPSVV